MSIEQIASEALRLPPEQRAQLAESLWESLEDPFLAPANMSDEAALSLARQRDGEIEQGLVQPISHEELMSRLRR
jgi:putative addiction module component (TIGR02574 family)